MYTSRATVSLTSSRLVAKITDPDPSGNGIATARHDGSPLAPSTVKGRPARSAASSGVSRGRSGAAAVRLVLSKRLTVPWLSTTTAWKEEGYGPPGTPSSNAPSPMSLNSPTASRSSSSTRSTR
jgi:hypothetical protein